MSGYNGLGSFSFTYNWVNDSQNGIPITASRMDGQFADATGGFDLVICRDGQSTTTAAIPFAQGATFGGVSSFSNTGFLGLGNFTPTNILDGVQNINSDANYQLVNQSAGTLAQSRCIFSNGTHSAVFGITGTGFTTSGLQTTDTAYIRTSATGGLTIFGTDATAPVRIGANSSEVARFIPSRGIAVATTVNYGGDASDFAYDGTTRNGVGINDVSSVTGSTFLALRSSGTIIGTITNNNNTGVLYNVTSDERLKTVLPVQRDHLDMIRNIWVGDVEYRTNPGTPVLAILAQQTNKFYPECITEPNELQIVPGEEDQKEELFWQADYSRLAPLALKGVQALLEKIDVLEAKISALEAK